MKHVTEYCLSHDAGCLMLLLLCMCIYLYSGRHSGPSLCNIALRLCSLDTLKEVHMLKSDNLVTKAN